MRKTLIPLSVIASSLLLAACGGGNDAGSSKPGSEPAKQEGSSGGKTLVYCSEGSPGGFDPGQYTAGTDFDAAAYPIRNGLVQFERGGTEAKPALAEKWDIA